MLIATLIVFGLCRVGYFSNPNVEIADSLQEALERILLGLLITSPFIFLASLLGGSLERRIVAALTVMGSVVPLIWLAFINLMRRN